MANHINLESVCADLDTVFEDFMRAYDKKDSIGCDIALRDGFDTILTANQQGLLPEAELSQYVSTWKRSVSKLSEVSAPNVAFMNAYDAWKMCRLDTENLPCDPLILNAVASRIHQLALPALKAMSERYTIVPPDVEKPYLFAVSDVLIKLAPHLQYPLLQERFQETFEAFKDILSSGLIPPTEVYKHVNLIKDYADTKTPQTNVLSKAMDSLLSDSFMTLPPRPKPLHNLLEAQAEKLGQESRNYKQPTGIEVALALRAGVDRKYADLYQKVEASFREKNYGAAESNLYLLFHRLANEKDVMDVPRILSTYTYLKTAADRLAEKSLVEAFHLSARCMNTLEDEGIFSKPLERAVVAFAEPVIEKWEAQKREDDLVVGRYCLEMMKQTTEFLDDESIASFEEAAIGYRQYLESLTPAERFGELWGIADWLEKRENECWMLNEFVEKMMDGAPKESPQSNIYIFKPRASVRSPENY